MMKRMLAAGVFTAIAALSAPKPAAAHVDFSVAIGIPPVYGSVVVPAPVFVPEPVYVPAPPAYYYPAPYPVGYYHYYHYPKFKRFKHHHHGRGDWD